MTAGRAALVGLLDRYLLGLLDPFVTLLEAHKLMYFMQAAGEPLELRFAKGHTDRTPRTCGTCCTPSKAIFVSGYADGGDAPDRHLQLVPGALEEARAFLEDKADTHARFARVSELVDGFESPFGLELLATVHWVAAEKATVPDLDEVTTQTYRWNERKKQFSRRQIELALGVLSEQGWLSLAVHH